MAHIKVTGNIQETSKETDLEWKITLIAGSERTSHLTPTFSFADTKWRLQFKPESYEKPGFAHMSLCNKNYCKYSMEYYFGFKKLDGSVQQVDKGILMEGDIRSPSFYCTLSEIQKIICMSSLDVLCITCTLKRGSTHLDQPAVLKEHNHKKINLDVLSGDFKDLLTRKDNCDVVLQVKDREFKAHKTILMARSAVFAAMFQYDTLENQTSFIKIPDCDTDTFQEFLEYLYCGKIENISYGTAYHLYYTSHKYGIQKLEEFCVEILIISLTSNNVCDVVILADKFNNIKLQSATQHFFTENFSKIIVTSEWESLLRNDYLLASELLIKMSKIKGSH